MTAPRYCMETDAIRHLHREGLGWGHDLDCGCAEGLAGRPPAGRGLLSRVARRVTGES